VKGERLGKVLQYDWKIKKQLGTLRGREKKKLLGVGKTYRFLPKQGCIPLGPSGKTKEAKRKGATFEQRSQLSSSVLVGNEGGIHEIKINRKGSYI